MKRPFEITVVLVRSIYESNVGAASRAMSNMGFHKLVLIDPKCELTLKAQQAAATGQEALTHHKVYSSLQEFYAGEPQGIRLGLTARDGRGRAVEPLKSVLHQLESAPIREAEIDSDVLPVHLIFGPEDWGLSAEDLNFSHYCCSLPTYGENSSLNLAQAVLLALFVVRDTWGGQLTALDGGERKRPLPSTSVFPETTLKNWLEELGYDLSKPKINIYTTLKRMILHNVPTSKELKALEMVLQQNIRKLKDYRNIKTEQNSSIQKNS